MQIFFVEGNIGTGKSTFLSVIEKNFSDVAQVIYEPVDVWTSFTDNENRNILDYFYSDPKRYAYMFQNLAIISRIERVKMIDRTKQFVFIERSIWSDKFVFALQCHENNVLSDIEFKIYSRSFDWMEESITNAVQGKKFIYLDSNPEICYKRIHTRGRPEEQTISMEYLKQLDAKHKEWFSKVPQNDIIIVEDNFNISFIKSLMNLP